MIQCKLIGRHGATTECRATFYRMSNELSRLARQWTGEREIIDMLYVFIAPLFVQIFYPVIGLNMLVGHIWQSKARILCITLAGYVMHFCLFQNVAGLSILGAILCNISVHTVFAIPYIYVNIFQHIGLPMYDVRKRPKGLASQAQGYGAARSS